MLRTCVTLLYCTSAFSDSSLKDLPVVGTTAQYSLNGDDWQAVGTTRDFSGHCTYEAGVDYNPTARSVSATPVAYHGSLEQCCQLCGASATCAASVWDGSHCVFKTASDLAHRVTNQKGKTACRIGNVGSRLISMKASVPGDLVTDLERAGLVDNPLFNRNFLNASVWAGPQWIYTKNFSLSSELVADGTDVLLVFDGIKMGAAIALNGYVLGAATNQHRRWIYEINATVLHSASPRGVHSLTVTFHASITTEGRYMDCSGGWDWAPYSYMRDADGNPAWTKGIWKGVYLVGVARAAAAITYFVPQVLYTGEHYPTAPLEDGTASFRVDVRLYLHAQSNVSGSVLVAGDWGNKKQKVVTLTAGENLVLISLAASGPKLWWANGMGAQYLYNMTASFLTGDGDGNAPTAVRRIGFRHVVLATFNDTNSTWVAQAEKEQLQGNGHHTLMFRMNGAPFFAKGANQIPMESLEGRYQIGMHRQLVHSAADAGMNFMRIWGGGIYPYDEFVDTCDERGLLVFSDMMYGTDGIMPGASATPNQAAELRHQVRRLGHHASVIAWSGCNECGGMGVYTDFVMTTVADEDQSRPVRSSCPWVGYETGVDALTGFPNGQKLTPVPAPPPPPPPPVPPPSKTCEFEGGVDYHPDTVMASTSTDDPAQCCADCEKKTDCVVAVLYAGICYLKADQDAKVKYNRTGGRISCKPKMKPMYNQTFVVVDALGSKSIVGPLRQPKLFSDIPGVQHRTGHQSTLGDSPFPGGDDIHGPYQHGGMFPARNGGGNLFAPPVVVDVQPAYQVGASQPGYFRTETGCSVLSSFESMAPTLSKSNWGMHSDPFHERNYPCDPIVLSYFNSSRSIIDLDLRGEAEFKKQLYLCMLGQGLQRKTDIESWRSGNIWGVVMWQLAEIWPTGGWGSLEYGTPSQPGQVLGGRWKPLHYFMRKSAFADVLAACGNAKLQLNDAGPMASGATMCYVKNDSPRAFSGTVTVELIHFATAAVHAVGMIPVKIGAGAGATAFFCPDGSGSLQNAAADAGAPKCPTFEDLFSKAGCQHGGADCIMRVSVNQNRPAPAIPLLVSDNLLPLAVPSSFMLPAATVTAKVVSDSVSNEGVLETVSIQVKSESPGVALYVWLSTLANGRFSDNGFLMIPGVQTVQFIPFGRVDIETLRNSLRVEHLGEHLFGRPQLHVQWI